MQSRRGLVPFGERWRSVCWSIGAAPAGASASAIGATASVGWSVGAAGWSNGQHRLERRRAIGANEVQSRTESAQAAAQAMSRRRCVAAWAGATQRRGARVGDPNGVDDGATRAIRSASRIGSTVGVNAREGKSRVRPVPSSRECCVDKSTRSVGATAEASGASAEASVERRLQRRLRHRSGRSVGCRIGEVRTGLRRAPAVPEAV